MDFGQGLMHGFSIALQPIYIYYALIGSIMGTITGVLPGLGPLGAMAILLSFTLKMDAVGAMILFAGIYYGAMYGGSITSILLNMPGEAASVVTCIDGYKMAQKGRGGSALTVAAVGSFIAGTVSILGLTVVTLFLADVALQFGPQEFLAIALCGLVMLIRLTEGSLLQTTIMILLGMAFGTVGMDFVTGTERFTFGISELCEGIGFLPVAMGLFGIAEVLSTSDEEAGSSELKKVSMRELLPTRAEWRRSLPAAGRGSILGFIIGLIPGPSPVISTFVSYITERRLSKRPEEFGHGAIEAVAGPEAANNAAVGGAYVPLFALGIPFTPAMAVVLGTLMMHGLTPGPNLINEKPDLFWTVIASMYIGNFMLLIQNLPLVNLFAYILKIPRFILMPLIVIICMIGVFCVNSSQVELICLALFGLLGYWLRKLNFAPAPLVLALVIGDMLETSLRQSLNISGGNFIEIFLKPISLSLYILVGLFLLVPVVVGRLRAKSND